jgi:hypothetical protein
LTRLKNWPSPQAKEWVYEFATAACTNPSTRALIAIGSIVRQVPKTNDVDLVYVLRGHRVSLADRPLDVDLRVYDAADVPALVRKGHDVLGWALSFGEVICEQDEYWSALRRKFRPVPLPDPCTSESRAATTEERYRDLRTLGDEEAAREQLVSALTHRAWARLLKAGVYPTSRPEVPKQLRDVGADTLADALEAVLGGQLIDLPIETADPRSAGANYRSPTESLGKRTERRLTEGLEDFARGRSYGPFRTGEEAAAFLRTTTGRKHTRRRKRRVGGGHR